MSRCYQYSCFYMWGNWGRRRWRACPGFLCRSPPSSDHKVTCTTLLMTSGFWHMKELLETDWRLESEQLETSQADYANSHVNSCCWARSRDILFSSYCWDKHRWIAVLLWDEPGELSRNYWDLLGSVKDSELGGSRSFVLDLPLGHELAVRSWDDPSALVSSVKWRDSAPWSIPCLSDGTPKVKHTTAEACRDLQDSSAVAVNKSLIVGSWSFPPQW